MRVVFAGGGTSGHVNPAIATAKYIKKVNPDAEILFIGTKDHVEAPLFITALTSMCHVMVVGRIPRHKASFRNSKASDILLQEHSPLRVIL